MRWIFFVTCYFLLPVVEAQDTVRLSLADVLIMAENNYPKLKSDRYQLEASKANIKLQQQTIIPQLDAAYQANLATRNNITGMFYPQYTLPISGPPSANNDYGPVTGSAASLLLQWQPGIFGERTANINLATASTQTLQSKNEQDVFSHKIKVCGQYIDLVYVQKLLKLYEENIRISENQLSQVKVLTGTGLRPGVDTALIQSELSRSRIEWLKIKNALGNSIALLQESLATDSVIIGKDTLLYSLVPRQFLTDTIEHPLIKTARLSIEEANTKRIAISKLAIPHLSVWGTTYARGSGVDYSGAVKTFDGFALNRFNYGLGVQIAVPLLKQTEIRTKLQQQDWLIKSEQEKLNGLSSALKEQKKYAEMAFTNARLIAMETPTQIRAAEYAFRSMQVRYTNGLVNYTELLQLQSALLKAKIDQANAQSEWWKALLYKAAVYGDINLFINQVK